VDRAAAIGWGGLEAELTRWRGLGRRPRLWWRDDDARRPTSILDRLLEIAGGLPLSLAVIPSGNMRAMGKWLRGHGQVTLSQHGVDHVNRRAPGEPPGELPIDAAEADVTAHIAAGRERISMTGVVPAFFTPPFNRVDEVLAPALIAAGFSAFSAWGALGLRPPPLWRLDTHIEILQWAPSPSFLGEGAFLGEFAQALRRRREAGAFDEPVGLLTHHLSHDEASWSFLERFTAFSRTSFDWRAFASALSPASQAPSDV
jgi:hypothetical protein